MLDEARQKPKSIYFQSNRNRVRGQTIFALGKDRVGGPWSVPATVVMSYDVTADRYFPAGSVSSRRRTRWVRKSFGWLSPPLAGRCRHMACTWMAATAQCIAAITFYCLIIWISPVFQSAMHWTSSGGGGGGCNSHVSASPGWLDQPSVKFWQP